MSNEQLIRLLNLLIGKSYLWEAEKCELTVAEYNLIIELGEWYDTKGKKIAESRRLTQMQSMIEY